MGRKRKKASGRREVSPDEVAPSGEPSGERVDDATEGEGASTSTKSGGSKGATAKGSKGSAGKGSKAPGAPGRARPSAASLLAGGPEGPVVAPPSAPGAVRVMLFVAATIYLSMLFLGGTRSSVPARVLPASMLYLTQATCLFPRAARMAIDYRVEGWDCVSRRFVELDPAPHFPIHADDKESRFQRVGHFHRRNRPVMEALERYLVGREREAGVNIGGVRVSSLRIPFPEPGEPVSRWAPAPLESYPEEQRKVWFHTPTSRRRAHCAGTDPFAERDERAAGAGANGRAREADGVDDEEPSAGGRREISDVVAFEDDEDGEPTEVRFFDEEIDAVFEGTPVGPSAADSLEPEPQTPREAQDTPPSSPSSPEQGAVRDVAPSPSSPSSSPSLPEADEPTEEAP